MNTPSLFSKVAVLSGFILLLSGFVAYRSGAFDQIMTGNKHSSLPPIGANSVNSSYPSDTIPKADSVPQVRTIMPSSKSIVMPENYDYIIKDDKPKKKLKKKDKANKKSDTADKKPTTIFTGSKSGPIIRPRVTTTDTAKKNQ